MGFTDPGSEVEMTITFASTNPKLVTSLDLYNNSRSITYAVYDGATAGTSGRGTGTFTGPNSASMDTEFEYDADDKTLTIGDTTVTTTPSTGTPATESMWRDWVFADGEATSGHIVKDTKFYGKFVLAWINVNFVPDTSEGCFQPNVSFDPAYTNKFEIHMDSQFGIVDTQDMLKAKASFDFDGTEADKTMEITITSLTSKVKFATPAFNNPTAGVKINEEIEGQDLIEVNTYDIVYKVIERTPVKIQANLDGGAFVNYTLPEISTEKGGKPAWTETAAGSGI